MKGRTVVIIAHRLSTVRNASKVCTLSLKEMLLENVNFSICFKFDITLTARTGKVIIFLPQMRGVYRSQLVSWSDSWSPSWFFDVN
jgi:hypothetical protein